MSGGIMPNTASSHSSNQATLPSLSTSAKNTGAPTPVMATSNLTESPSSSPESDRPTRGGARGGLAAVAARREELREELKEGFKKDVEDPLIALEKSLMARPLRSFTLPVLHGEEHAHLFHHHLSPEDAEEGGAGGASAKIADDANEAPLEHGHSFHFHPRHSHDHLNSRSPTPGARRCMEATAAWTPRLDRRQSWDGQAYRRAVMEQTNGMLHGVCPRHHHNMAANGEYEAETGFTETVRHASHEDE